MNFKTTVTPTSLTIAHPSTKTKLVLSLEGKKFTATKTRGSLEVREANCLSYLTKFALDMLNRRSNKPASTKIDALNAQLLPLRNVSSFRTLNNSLRRVMDDGTPEYFAKHFYEGRSTKATVVVEPAPKAKKASVKKTTDATPVVKVPRARKATKSVVAEMTA